MGKHAAKQRIGAAASIAKALALHQQGRHREAGELYDHVLANEPRNFDALHLNGVLKHQQGRSSEGLRLVAAALKTTPGSVDGAAQLQRSFWKRWGGNRKPWARWKTY